MKKLPIVALIGQTNAGKSSLLNRFARRRVAIVAREEGTTRDNVVVRVDERFLLIDTAGLKDPADDFEAGIQSQISDAVEVADLIVMVLDSSKYTDHRDQKIARLALKSGKPVLMALNKTDLGDSLPETEFRALAVPPEQMYRVSATTGRGVEELKGAIIKELVKGGVARTDNNATDANDGVMDVQEVVDVKWGGDVGVFDDGRTLKIALIGRPNVGKSSLFNSLAQKQQALVSSRQGTTRDVNRVVVNYHKRPLEILDTAGLRRPGRREVGIEKFSALRTLATIEEADICALLIDVTESHAKLDQSLAGQIVKAGKGIIVVVTKMDLATSTREEILNGLERDFDFIPYAPVLMTSAETGANVTRLFELALEIDEARRQEIPTAALNKILMEAVAAHPPAGLKNTRPKPKYMVQTDIAPPWFVVHGHELGLLHWSYKRFLERKIREQYPLVGVPMFFSFRSDKRRRRDGET